MTQVTLAELRQLAPTSIAKFANWVAPLNAAMAEFGIATETRVEMFIAQAMHESARFAAVSENLNYSAQGLLNTWPSRFTPVLAAQYARQPEAIANYVYANRNGNGDAASGDGYHYRARALLGLTGRANYAACADGTGIDCVNEPEALEDITNSCRAAAWWWQAHGLNQLADTKVFAQTTKVINGGDIGGADRIGLWTLTQTVIV